MDLLPNTPTLPLSYVLGMHSINPFAPRPYQVVTLAGTYVYTDTPPPGVPAVCATPTVAT